MKNLSRHLSPSFSAPASQPLPGRESEMEPNRAGGYGFKMSDWDLLDRFLVLGTEGGTYYVSERDLTVDSAAVVRRCLEADMARALQRIEEVSLQGLAPRNDPAILAVAIAFTLPVADGTLRARALSNVCRTGTHLFQFLQAVRGLRGGGRSLNSAVRRWLERRDVDQLALQVVKYPSRCGWTWRDVMRRFRPRPPVSSDGSDLPRDEARRALYAHMAGKLTEDLEPHLPAIVRNAALAHEIASTVELSQHVRATRLPWEAVPSEATTDPHVLEALFESMPMTATVRQLSKLQAHGVLPKRRADAVARLTDREQIKRSRIHPVAYLLAADAYERGAGRHLTWAPDPQIVDALDEGFHRALECAEPINAKLLVAIDSSGSMTFARQTAEHCRKAGVMPPGGSGLDPLKFASAMALTLVRQATDVACMAFDAASHRNRTGFAPLPVSPRQRVTDVIRAIQDLGLGGGTDCSLPFRVALRSNLFIDAFVVFTDNETWSGGHPAEALREYRLKVNPEARVVWCAMTADRASCGDPADPLSLSIGGFDASVPKLISGFLRGRF